LVRLTPISTMVAVALSCGCGPSPAFEPEPPSVVIPPAAGHWTPPPDDPAIPFAMGQSWIGTYTCAQGETQLVLQIVNVDGPTVDALFTFHHPPSDVHGVFQMTGTYTPTYRELTLRGGRWIDRPAGYVTVDLRGRVPLDGKRFVGTVDGPGCSVFALRRSR
jgi:hypothetical protein